MIIIVIKEFAIRKLLEREYLLVKISRRQGSH